MIGFRLVSDAAALTAYGHAATRLRMQSLTHGRRFKVKMLYFPPYIGICHSRALSREIHPFFSYPFHLLSVFVRSSSRDTFQPIGFASCSTFDGKNSLGKWWIARQWSLCRLIMTMKVRCAG